MYNFNEKEMEYSSKQRCEIPVWISPKYEQSKAMAIKIIEKYDDITEADFWILMNETKTGKMAYTGLIISHNGCLKINDHLMPPQKFKAECVTYDKDGYHDSLVFMYQSAEQGLYEVGEVSSANCKNAYPYAMAFKRLFDRVVLKTSKLAFSGIYSESESEEFRRSNAEELDAKITGSHIRILETRIDETSSDREAFLNFFGVDKIEHMSEAQYGEALNMLNRKAKG